MKRGITAPITTYSGKNACRWHLVQIQITTSWFLLKFATYNSYTGGTSTLCNTDAATYGICWMTANTMSMFSLFTMSSNTLTYSHIDRKMEYERERRLNERAKRKKRKEQALE